MKLAYKEVTKEVTAGMDSIIHIKVQCQVLPWLHQGGLFLVVLKPSACQQCAWPAQPSAARRHLFMGQAQPQAAPPCQVPNDSSSCNQRPSGQ